MSSPCSGLPSRREFLRAGVLALGGLSAGQLAAANTPTVEPLEIGATPQLLLDGHVVDNTWALRYKSQHVDRVFHAPRKHPSNPLIKTKGGYVCAARDESTGAFHLWYQTHVPGTDERKTQYAVAYATSPDGIKWTLPKLGLHEWQGSKENNIVIRGPRRRASGVWLLNVPEKDRRGYKYVLSYRDADGTHLVGTHDGVHFDPRSDRRIQDLHSDTQNAIVYDPHERQYVMYCRAKATYRAFGEEMLDTGESRRIARVASKELWGDWPREAANILLPDELDTKHRYHAFYGMPTTVYAGVFFGFLWPFRWNDRIHTELAWSRDGVQFERHPLRPRLVDYGPADSWEDEMVFAGGWVEVGDEWWIYYSGWDGPHNTPERNGGIGLATLRKEGFVSLRGPRDGGVICTRPLRWPGGGLRVNADASQGELRVRVSDHLRKPLAGFNYDDCKPLKGDGVSQLVAWNEKSAEALKDRTIRLEFLARNCDLFSFRAEG
jgi:hypothetical protein